MNWKDPIILGAIAGSGKFRVQYKTLNAGNRIAEIEGIECIRPYLFTDKGSIKVKDCKLIARPISDMSDEEINKHPNMEFVDDYDWGKKHIQALNTRESFLYLLSIGVLPELLADEYVIWRNKNK